MSLFISSFFCSKNVLRWRKRVNSSCLSWTWWSISRKFWPNKKQQTKYFKFDIFKDTQHNTTHTFLIRSGLRTIRLSRFWIVSYRLFCLHLSSLIVISNDFSSFLILFETSWSSSFLFVVCEWVSECVCVLLCAECVCRLQDCVKPAYSRSAPFPS